MSVKSIFSLGLGALLAMAMAACTMQEPDIIPEEQVGAEQRAALEEEEEGAEGEGEGGGEGGGDTLTFVAEDIAWGDHPSELPAGEVTLEIDNQGAALHDITIEELGDETVAEAEGGETDSGSVTLEPGEYTVYCSVSGHREAGMETTVTAAE